MNLGVGRGPNSFLVSSMSFSARRQPHRSHLHKIQRCSFKDRPDFKLKAKQNKTENGRFGNAMNFSRQQVQALIPLWKPHLFFNFNLLGKEEHGFHLWYKKIKCVLYAHPNKIGTRKYGN